MAYLHALLRDPIPLFSLIRISGGFTLLSEEGTLELLSRMTGKTPWGRHDLKSVFRFKQSPIQLRVQSDCRRLAVASAKDVRRLVDVLPRGFSYLNVGHSNISDVVFRAIQANGGQISVLVHDTIPLDYPEFQRDGSVEKFKQKMSRVSLFADLVIFNSEQSKLDATRHFSKMGRVPKSIVAHLGLTTPTPPEGALPPEIDPNKGYFVTVGTIEPRKNHALLLDIWEGLENKTNSPQLVIIGARGWKNEAVFKRLDLKPRNVVEFNNLSDRAVAQIVERSAGMLFPSIAEGYGLPPAEAILQQTPVICGDLPVYREFLGDIPIYADTSDRYLWELAIQKLARRKREKTALQFDLKKMPTWEAHFNKVLKVA
ncbi:glycosyltransferase family 4 protein [Falsihalocynthiibacter sp. BN13B15]|uniref:glycosyltransferase family 4 protein n=1 Tax=Falsihalocynthiibacter sp. BN13B15 TaxID=3240871 RepID=UPI0035102C4B